MYDLHVPSSNCDQKHLKSIYKHMLVPFLLTFILYFEIYYDISRILSNPEVMYMNICVRYIIVAINLPQHVTSEYFSWTSPTIVYRPNLYIYMH